MTQKNILIGVMVKMGRSTGYIKNMNSGIRCSILTIFKYMLAVSFISFIVTDIHAALDTTVHSEERPRIGLVLSGGGARGAAHIGVLKVLDRLKIPVDIITGTSMGSVTGGLYAYGYSPIELEEKMAAIDWAELFEDRPQRTQRNFRRKQDDYNYLVKLEAGYANGSFKLPTGLIQGQKLDLMLRSLMPDAPDNFDALPILFRAVAEDIESGEAVAIGNGDIVSAIRASMSIPGVFAPVERDGRLLVDGGFANNLPIELAREMGADILIVVDLTNHHIKETKLDSPLRILNQNMGFMIQRNTQRQLDVLGSQDVLIQPNLQAYSSTDFWHIKEMIAQGVDAANKQTASLMKYSMDANSYDERVKQLRLKKPSANIVDEIRINNDSKLSNEVIRTYISAQPGESLNVKSLQKDIQRLYGLDIFERVSYETTQELNKTILTIHVRKKTWGPNYVRFGLNLESDFEGSSLFNIASSMTSTPLNSYGGEWRTELQLGNEQAFSTEFYQPLDKLQRYFARVEASYSESHFARYEAGQQVSDEKSSSTTINLAVGREFDNRMQLQLGLVNGKGDSDILVGSRAVPRQDFQIGAGYIGFAYDQLDDVNFPKKGVLSNINWVSSREDLGADFNQDSMSVNALWADTWGRHTFVLWSGLTGVIDSDSSAADAFALGGFLNLSGYREQELLGRYAGIARLIYLNNVAGNESLFNIPVYLGGSLEVGNTWNDKDDISFNSLKTAGSLIVGFDTPVGPLYLSKGFAEGGRSGYYLFLGRSFTFF